MSDEIPDPADVKFTFSKTKRDGDDKMLPDGYVDANIREVGDREQMQLMLTIEQAQGWAETLTARLSHFDQQVAEQLSDYDQAYAIRLVERKGRLGDIHAIAFSDRDAKEHASRLRHEHPMSEVEIEQIDFVTYD